MLKREQTNKYLLFVLVAMVVFTTTVYGATMKGKMNLTGIPIVKEKVTLHAVGLNMNNTRSGRWDETEMFQKLEKDTNVKIVWDMIPQTSWQEKKNLIVASRQLPDLFMAPFSLSANEIASYGADGVLIPLDGLLKKYAPNVTRVMKAYPSYVSYAKSQDGKIYALPNIEDNGVDSQSAAIINQEWLNKLGLKMPTTTDEFYNVLRAFKTKDPNGNGQTDEIPFSFLFQEATSINREVKREFEWVYLAFGANDNPKRVAIDDKGKVFFTANTERWKEATKFMHKLYAEGLIDSEVFTQDRALLTNKLRNKLNIGVYTDFRKDISIASEEIQNKFSIMPPLKGPHGDRKWLRCFGGMAEGTFAITSKCKNPEVAIRWLDYLNTPEIAIQSFYGIFKPAGFGAAEALIPSKDFPGKWDSNQSLRPKGVSPSDWPFTAPIVVTPALITREIQNKYLAAKPSTVSKENACAVYRPYLTKYPHNYPYKFNPVEVEELSLLQTDIAGYVLKMQAKWIVDGKIDAEWQDYQNQLKKLQIDRYVALYKKAFSRTK